MNKESRPPCSYYLKQLKVHCSLKTEALSVVTSTQCQLHMYLICTNSNGFSRITLQQSFQNQTCSSSLDDQALQKEGS
uniref:Uncharacterized protein n=1 Tax=Arundo donax TaxID=35708 RepID=A0A0A9EYA3_ARUDO